MNETRPILPTDRRPSPPTASTPAARLPARELAWLVLPLVAAVFFCAAPALASVVDDWDLRGEMGFLRAAHERLQPRWNGFLRELGGMPPGTRFHDDEQLAADVVMGVDRDGRIVRTELASRSGLDGFDQAPVDLLHDVATLPPPPASLRSDDGLVYVRWRFSRDPDGCDERGVVERRLPLAQAIVRLVEDGRVEVAVERVREAQAHDPAEGAAALSLLAQTIARVAAGDADPRRRVAGAMALAHDVDSEPMLARMAVEDGDDGVRRAALGALGERPRSREALEVLVAALTTQEATVAVRALVRLDERRAVPTLRRMLADGRISVEVARALRLLGDSDEASRVVGRMLADGGDHRDAAVQAARELAQPSLAPALVGLMKDPSETLRGRALSAIAAMGARVSADTRRAVLAASLDTAPSVRAIAAEAMGRWGEHSSGLRYRLMDLLSDRAAPVRAEAAASLVAVGGAAMQNELMRPLVDADPVVRAALGVALVEHPFAGSLPLATRLAADPDEQVRLAVYQAIPENAARDLRTLRAHAVTDPSSAVRAAVLPASPAVTPRDAFSAAAWLLRADGPSDRVAAAAAWLAASDHVTPERAPQLLQAHAAVMR